MTIIEDRGSIEGCKVAFVGDGNNIVHSWTRLAKVLPFELVVVCPPGYAPDEETLRSCNDSGVGSVSVTHELSGVKVRLGVGRTQQRLARVSSPPVPARSSPRRLTPLDVAFHLPP